MPQILRSTVFSLLLVVGCASIPRPDTDICIVNAPGVTRKCYNLKLDYNDDGSLKYDAKPKYKPTATIADLNKNACTDPDGLANLKAYIQKLRKAYQDGCGTTANANSFVEHNQ